MSDEARPTKVVLVRHGHVDEIEPARFRGRVDLPLTTFGPTLAAETAARIALMWNVAAIYTSLLQRSRLTAREIAEATGINVRVEHDLVDTYYGAWQGHTIAEARERWPDEYDLWERTPHLANIPGGELLSNVQARIAQFTADLLHRHAGEAVVLVGHDSVNRVFLLNAFGLPLSAYWRFAQSPGAISELDLHPRSSVLQYTEQHQSSRRHRFDVIRSLAKGRFRVSETETHTPCAATGLADTTICNVLPRHLLNERHTTRPAAYGDTPSTQRDTSAQLRNGRSRVRSSAGGTTSPRLRIRAGRCEAMNWPRQR